MKDKDKQTHQENLRSKSDGVGEVEVVEVAREFRRTREDRIEIQVPPGIAVMWAGGAEGTRIVLLGFVSDRRQGSHGDADEGI